MSTHENPIANKNLKALFIAVCIFPISSFAAIYYVNDATFAGDTWCTAAGNDANSGLAVNLPKATIQDVFNDYDLAPGDIIRVDKGNYTQVTTINVASDAGDATAYVTIIGANRYTTIITAPATSHIFDIAGVGYIKISNLKMVSTQAAYYNVNLTGASSYCMVDNCILTSTGTNIHLAGTSHYCNIQNSHITSTGGTAYSGILLEDCDNVTFYKDTITANHYGFKFTDPGSQPNRERIKECVISVVSATQADGAGIWLDHSDNDTIIKNKISGGLNGIYCFYDSDDAYIVNNYIYNTARGYVAADQASNTSILRHNSFYTSGSCIYLPQTDGSTGFGAIFIRMRVHNNIFYSTAGAAGDAVIYSAPTQAFAGGINYNLYYNPSGARIGMYNVTYYTTLANWQAVDHDFTLIAGNGDVNSLSGNPNYATPASGALEITSNKRTGANYLASIPQDIYGTSRVLPVIGAWEDFSLPVELLVFKGSCQGQNIQLEWQTASEENSSHFILERSSNGSDFETITSLPAAGWSNTIKIYSFDDNISDISVEDVYYRLIQVDFDGATYNKGIIVVNNCVVNAEISVHLFPNPTEGNITAQVSSSGNDELTIAISDMQGRVVLDQNVLLEKGSQSISLSLTGLSSGVYAVEFIVKNQVQAVEKIIRR